MRTRDNIMYLAPRTVDAEKPLQQLRREKGLLVAQYLLSWDPSPLSVCEGSVGRE